MADWSEIAVEYEPLTVKCLFDFLCGKVSPEMAKSIINHLDCLTTVKSDLIEAIEKEDFARFDSLLRENGIDYDISARIMAYLTEQERYKLNGQEGVVDINTIDENTTDEEDEHQRMLMQRFTKEHIMDYCRKEALEEEYIEANAATFDRYYNAINKAYSQEKFVKGTVRECYFYFINLCNDIISYYNEECLTESETEMLTHFAETKIANFPAVKVYFKSFTKGKFISEGFEIIDNEKFAKAEKMLVKEVKANSPLPSKPRKKEFALPTKLDVMSEYGRASRLFEKAIAKGLIEEDEDKLRWNENPSLLDYFCGKLYCDDIVVTDKKSNELIWSHNGTKRMPCKSLNALFNYQYKIGNYRRNQIGHGTPPLNHGAIDTLFSAD